MLRALPRHEQTGAPGRFSGTAGGGAGVNHDGGRRHMTRTPPILVVSTVLALMLSCKPAARDQAGAVAPAATPTPESTQGYRFIAHALEPQVKDDLLVYGLWKEPAAEWSAIRLDPETEYLLGVERDVTPEERWEPTFTDQSGIVVPEPSGKPQVSVVGTKSLPRGVFFPAVQEMVVWDGIVRWIWGDSVRIEPAKPKGNVPLAFRAPKKTESLSPLTCPLLRGQEIETQAVVREGKWTSIRKVFRGRGRDLAGAAWGLTRPNPDRREEFPSLFGEISAEERQQPDIVLSVSPGRSATKGLSYRHEKAIVTSFLRLATRNSAPGFLAVDMSLDSWAGPVVKTTVQVKASKTAPVGDHYFRIVQRFDWDGGVALTGRIAKVTVVDKTGS
jgi:hypothetical protein